MKLSSRHLLYIGLVFVTLNLLFLLIFALTSTCVQLDGDCGKDYDYFFMFMTFFLISLASTLIMLFSFWIDKAAVLYFNMVFQFIGILAAIYGAFASGVHWVFFFVVILTGFFYIYASYKKIKEVSPEEEEKEEEEIVKRSSGYNLLRLGLLCCFLGLVLLILNGFVLCSGKGCNDPIVFILVGSFTVFTIVSIMVVVYIFKKHQKSLLINYIIGMIFCAGSFNGGFLGYPFGTQPFLIIQWILYFLGGLFFMLATNKLYKELKNSEGKYSLLISMEGGNDLGSIDITKGSTLSVVRQQVIKNLDQVPTHFQFLDIKGNPIEVLKEGKVKAGKYLPMIMILVSSTSIPMSTKPSSKIQNNLYPLLISLEDGNDLGSINITKESTLSVVRNQMKKHFENAPTHFQFLNEKNNPIEVLKEGKINAGKFLPVLKIHLPHSPVPSSSSVPLSSVPTAAKIEPIKKKRIKPEKKEKTNISKFFFI